MRIRRSAVSVLVLAGLLSGCKTAPKVQYEAITAEHKTLAARAEEVIRQTEGTPGKEQANRLRAPHCVKWLKMLKGETQAKKGELDWPIKDITRTIEAAQLGVDWPRPQEVKVPFTPNPVKIDGKLDDPAWAKAVTFNDVYQFNTKEKAATPKTTWKILWDKKCLYLAYDCVDSDIISPKIERDDQVYANDCVELFLLPDFRFRTYWELIIGPSGSIYDSIQCKNYDDWGCNFRTSETIQGLEVGIDIRGTLNQPGDQDQGYTVEVAFPFSEMPGYSRTGPQAGHRLHFMLVRLDKNGEEFKFYAFQPLLSWGHNIWNHARMVLAE
jgi:hypothetical protein